MKITARDIMSKYGVVSVRPKTTLGELDRILTQNRVSGVPVVNDQRSVVGVVSQSDIVRFIHNEFSQDTDFYSGPEVPRTTGKYSLEEGLKSKEVWEIMQTRLYTVSPDAELSDIAKTLRTHHIHRVLVLDGKRLVGVLSTFDLIFLMEDPQWVREFWQKAEGTTEGEVKFKTPQNFESS